MIKCHSSDTILNQIRHLTFIVNTGLCGTEDYITTLISEQRKVMVRLGKPSIKKSVNFHKKKKNEKNWCKMAKYWT